MSANETLGYPASCKICSGQIRYVGDLDSNKCCQDRMGKRTIPTAGEKVPYYACNNCSLVFTNYMDAWSPEDFKNNIYNSDYEWINPPIPGRAHVPLKETPSYQKGLLIASHFEGSQDKIRVLDFGAGGNPGPTGQGLIDRGFKVDSYEPFRADCAPLHGKYDLIVCIEVLEHCHNLKATVAVMKQFLSANGIVWIETLMHPHPTPDNILSSWYIAPRDGHISVHSFLSLTTLFNSVGLNFAQTARGTFAFGQLPNFPNRIFANA